MGSPFVYKGRMCWLEIEVLQTRKVRSSCHHRLRHVFNFKNGQKTDAGFGFACYSSLVSAAAGPCDLYSSGGTPCIAAHSTTRALYGAYAGPLYQVKCGSDNTTTNIVPLAAGGVANAAVQDKFRASTTCLITIIYDQSGQNNRSTVKKPMVSSYHRAPATVTTP